MNKIADLLLLIISFTLIGCTKEETLPELVQPTNKWSEAEEINHWIYQEMNHHYLWRDDLPDSLNCDYSITPKEFYESLLSSKDRFSYLSEKNSTRSKETCDLGFEFQEYNTDDGQTILKVLYITSQNAKNAGLRRGDFVRIDRQDTSSISLTILDVLDYTNNRSVKYSIPGVNVGLNQTVRLDSIYNINNLKVGYICYLEYDDPEDFFDSFQKFSDNNINELILDLRYNPGGLVSTCKKLCNLIVPVSAYGKMFQQCSYNEIVALENLEKYGSERTFSYFSTPTGFGGTGILKEFSYLSLPRIFILTSSHTASASESTINSLRPYMDVVVIGENTTGKGVGMQTLTTSKYKYALVPITFRFYNALDETIPDSGITPDYYVPDGYNTRKSELGDLSEPLLAKAIELITLETTPEKQNIENINLIEIKLVKVGEPSFLAKFKSKHEDY